MKSIASALCVLICLSAPAAAQDPSILREAQDRPEQDRGATSSGRGSGSAFVGGSVSAANMESHTEVAYAGSFGYRFSRVVSFTIEATLVPELESSFPPNVPIILASGTAPIPSGTVSGGAASVIYPGPIFANPSGRIVLFTNSARVDIPTTSTRLTPFFTAGGGIANVRRSADFGIYLPVPLTPGAPTIPIRPVIQRVTASETDLALTLGGGVGVRAARALWIDADLRAFRLIGNEDRNLGRFGVGVRYVF